MIAKKKQQLDTAMAVLDEKIANAFYRLILINGLMLALIGLIIFEPVPTLFGFGFVIIGILTMVLCMNEMNKSRRMIATLSK